jgi:hypothetical protein
LTAHLKAQHSAEWMFYLSKDNENQLRPRDFRIAMAIRCRTLPRDIRDRFARLRCNCGHTPVTIEDTIDHSLVCSSNCFTAATRHSEVKNAIAKVLADYGVARTVEPGFYNYADRRAHRPDITAHANPPVAIDITIVQQNGEVGDNAAASARQKIQQHQLAVTSAGHRFIPFALEAHGHVDDTASNFITHVQQSLRPHLKWDFKRDLLHAVSTALARSRAWAIYGMPQLAGIGLL